MKSKLTMGVFALALVAALIAGATSAWFTAEDEVPEVVFTAGTLEIDVDEAEVFAMDDRSVHNVNPGDCATLCWEIANVGSKSADLRVQIEGVWDGVDEEDEEYDEDLQVAFFIPAQDSDWVEGGDGWIYYQSGPVRGTYDYEADDGPDAEALEPETVELCLVVAFDGPNMGNAYQGASYTLDGIVEAVQGTNGAAEDLWEVDMEEIKAKGDDDNEHYDYFQNVICYTGENNGDEPGGEEPGGEEPGGEEPEKYAFKIGGLVRWNKWYQKWELSNECGTIIQGLAGDYEEGEKVTLVVKQNPGYVFQGWSTLPNRDGGGLIDGSAANYVGPTYTYEYTMPAHPVTLYAIFNH